MTQIFSDDNLVSVAPRIGSKYVAGLPFLRGIAALSVALYHFTGAALPKSHIDAAEMAFSRGYLGVDVFFVISGFIIPYSLLDKSYNPKRFFSYIFKRIVRINPPAYIAMLLVLLQWYIIDYYIAHKINYTAGLSVGQVIGNLLFIIPFSEYKWIVGIFWTLSIEFQFYIFIGLLFNYLFERKTIFFFILAYLLAQIIQLFPFGSSEHFFGFSTLFAMGGLTLFKRQGRLSVSIYLALLLIFGVLCYLQLGLYIALVGIITALAIEYVNLDNAITRFFGKISYSFYLVHVLVGNTCEFLLTKFIASGPIVNRIFMQLMCLSIAIGIAYGFYLFVERPFTKLASRLKS